MTKVVTSASRLTLRRLKFGGFLNVWLPVILWMALMFCGSTDLLSAEHTSRFITPILRWLKPDISPATIAQVHFLVRKAAHFTEYAILTGLLFRALSGLSWRIAAVLVIAVIFALGDEFHQSFVSSRTSSLGDVLIDCSGAVVALMLVLLARRQSAT